MPRAPMTAADRVRKNAEDGCRAIESLRKGNDCQQTEIATQHLMAMGEIAAQLADLNDTLSHLLDKAVPVTTEGDDYIHVKTE